MRLIDADTLKKCARVVFDKDLGRLRVVDVSDIDNAPTVEVRPQGEWIEQGYLEYKCSVCGRHISLEDHWTNVTKDFPFCYCGAKMKGGAE